MLFDARWVEIMTEILIIEIVIDFTLSAYKMILFII